MNSFLFVFVLCSYIQWKQALRSAWRINEGPLAEAKRALSLVQRVARLRPHSCLYSLSGQIISIASVQGYRSSSD